LSASGSFVGPGRSADAAVLVVTHQSEAVIDRLLASLRREAEVHRLRVIVADNASSDGTLSKLDAHSDVTTLSTGGNLGYAAGINVAARACAGGEPQLILNPDLEVGDGCIAALFARMRDSDAAVVVPRILDSDGQTYPSLRREPNLLGALGDACVGNRFARRPAVLSEVMLRKEDYGMPRRVDWATGAALLVDGRVAARISTWDESYFLYSEETDFLRRVRGLGAQVWYEPKAVVRHDKGGSGSSLELAKLLVVNRIRYVRKHRGRIYAGLYRGVVAFRELIRSYSACHRAVLLTVMSERRWSSLPGPSR